MKGNLIIIGGAEDKSGESKILKQAVDSIGGQDAFITIITTATEKPEAAGNEYKSIFERLGAKNTSVLNINTRDDANSQENCAAIEGSTGVFFTGGDQLRITSIIGGTKVHDTLKKSYFKGTAVMGTSAGASVMSNTMIIEGSSNDPARKCTLKMAPGLGFLGEVIIDQHFAQRGRIGRLLCAVAENPYMIGIGIDEDTAVKVYQDAHIEVLGSNAVTVIDGKTIKSSNVSELKPDDILAIANITLHVLPEGYGYDIAKRIVLRLH